MSAMTRPCAYCPTIVGGRVLFAAVLVGAWCLSTTLRAAEDEPYGIDHRVPWTTSRVVGSPEPPLPYAVEKTFTNIQWRTPIFITREPGSEALLVVQAGGEKGKPSKILRVQDEPTTTNVATFLEVTNRLIYSVAFHPGYRTNHQIFVFSHWVTGELARTNRVSRFAIEPLPSPRCDLSSERVIIEWRSEGHDGGGLVFGHDGMLYISSGDGTSDSDGWVTGQDLNELLGGVLRIDVDRAAGTQAYLVPSDNPFVALTSARPENWAYGLRNPWRMCVDEKTGQIWVGNNGQDHWETAHLLRRGENYGWSVYEGSHPFYLNRRSGPTPIVLPTIEHSHARFRSLTGGEVYYGDEFPELNGHYVYGDYSTGEIWGARHDGSRVKAHRQLARTQLQLTAFANDHRGGLLIADHAGAIYRLVRAPQQRARLKFPTRLSQTGLFISTRDHRVQAGVIPYSVNAPGWVDGAGVERFMALPDDSRLGRLTNGAALVQTLSLERKAGDPGSRQRIETRLLTHQDGQWAGYSYRWDERQSDATLVEVSGAERTFVIKDPQEPGGERRQVWRYPSRVECMTCHSRAANFVLGLTDGQLNKSHDYAGVRDNQLRTLQHIGIFTGTLPKPSAPALVDPYSSASPLDARARSYLHANCAMCHMDAGGGNSRIELRITTKPDRMNIFGARPQHDTFGIDNAMLVFPGDPDRSVLYQRLSRRGRGQMPPLVTRVVDERAVHLFHDWIREMKPEQNFVREWTMEALEPALLQVKSQRSFESGRSAFTQLGCGQCHRLAGDGGSVGPDLTGVGSRRSARELLESLVLPSKVIVEGFAMVEIETKTGDVLEGRIEREDERVIVFRPSTASETVATIRKTDVRRRRSSQSSNMPAGIINTLEQAQILDLLAYVMADGKADDPAFDAKPAAGPAEP